MIHLKRLAGLVGGMERCVGHCKDISDKHEGHRMSKKYAVPLCGLSTTCFQSEEKTRSGNNGIAGTTVRAAQLLELHVPRISSVFGNDSRRVSIREQEGHGTLFVT